MDRKKFYDAVRPLLFAGSISTSQVDGVETILNEWDRRGYVDPRWLAYILATAYHETSRTMQPIDEMGGPSYWTKMYDVNGNWPDRARQNGNTVAGDGITYHGRGYPQLTWKNNYAKMGSLLGVDLVGNPELAKEHPWAERIMFEGMLRADSHFGDFTGAAIDDFFTPSKDDPFNARRAVNGLDCAQKIADYHHNFLTAVHAGLGG